MELTLRQTFIFGTACVLAYLLPWLMVGGEFVPVVVFVVACLFFLLLLGAARRGLLRFTATVERRRALASPLAELPLEAVLIVERHAPDERVLAGGWARLDEANALLRATMLDSLGDDVWRLIGHDGRWLATDRALWWTAPWASAALRWSWTDVVEFDAYPASTQGWWVVRVRLSDGRAARLRLRDLDLFRLRAASGPVPGAPVVAVPARALRSCP
jgi:hypothetical protein